MTKCLIYLERTCPSDLVKHRRSSIFRITYIKGTLLKDFSVLRCGIKLILKIIFSFKGGGSPGHRVTWCLLWCLGEQGIAWRI